MAHLLVSVRSAAEAREALEGGAAIIDVKEPSRGSLGMASTAVWRRVREAVPSTTVVSVALGELSEWTAPRPTKIPRAGWEGIHLRKIGLAESGPRWREGWAELRSRIDRDGSPASDGRPSWVAAVYLDWERAGAPEPDAVINEAAGIVDCVGILFDTFDKSRRADFGPGLSRWIDRAKDAGRFVALAGSLDEAAIRRLRPLGPDIFAVRGAACHDGDRRASVDRECVARLASAAAGSSDKPFHAVERAPEGGGGKSGSGL